MNTTDFWQALDTLVVTSSRHIDRPRGTRHPRYPDIIYPLDYGYLQDTRSGDGDGIDIWIGTLPGQQVTAIILTVDLVKRDTEMKILLGCSSEEQQIVLAQHQRYKGSQAAMLVEHPREIQD